MSNTWVICPPVGNSLWKHRIIPDAMVFTQVEIRKGAKAPPADEPASHSLDGEVKAHHGDDG